MSMFGDVFAALKNVVLMQERIDVMQQKLDRFSSDVRGLSDYAVSVDKRVLRIETMIEMSGRGFGQPRIEQ